MNLGTQEYVLIGTTLITIAVRHRKFFYITIFLILISQIAIIDFYKSGSGKEQIKKDWEIANKIICIKYGIKLFSKTFEICL